jgi:hypothetical protein
MDYSIYSGLVVSKKVTQPSLTRTLPVDFVPFRTQTSPSTIETKFSTAGSATPTNRGLARD